MSSRIRIISIDYTNWQGERRIRKIEPIQIYFGSNKFHPKDQWLLEALDIQKNENRTFALNMIHEFLE